MPGISCRDDQVLLQAYLNSQLRTRWVGIFGVTQLRIQSSTPINQGGGTNFHIVGWSKSTGEYRIRGLEFGGLPGNSELGSLRALRRCISATPCNFLYHSHFFPLHKFRKFRFDNRSTFLLTRRLVDTQERLLHP